MRGDPLPPLPAHPFLVCQKVGHRLDSGCTLPIPALKQAFPGVKKNIWHEATLPLQTEYAIYIVVPAKVRP